ncbi:MAG: cytochrome c [Pseudomonadota bacterium]
MTRKLLATIFVICNLAPSSIPSYAAEPPAQQPGIKLSPDIQNLLRAEMREITTGVQGIAVSLATADWQAIQETSMKIRTSYIMEKKLTPAQAKELEQALPERFKQIDEEFHQRAERLGVAAAAHDPELVAFHYSRLVESCALCHAAFAKSRFPGFSSPAQQEHHH